MSIEALILSHAGVLIAAIAGTIGGLKLAGWKSALEHELGLIKQHLGLGPPIHAAQTPVSAAPGASGGLSAVGQPAAS